MVVVSFHTIRYTWNSNTKQFIGWGIGFLKTLVNGAIGTDFGHNGATTVSFVAGADWPSVLDAVSRSKADFVPYVTIQVCTPPLRVVS